MAWVHQKYKLGFIFFSKILVFFRFIPEFICFIQKFIKKILKIILLICIDFRNDIWNWMGKDKNFAPIISIIRYPSDHLLCFHTSQSHWKSEKAKLKCTFDNICSIYREFRPWTCIHDFLIPLFFHLCWTDQFQNIITTVVFRGPIFCRQCFQIPLDLILSYHFILMFIN